VVLGVQCRAQLGLGFMDTLGGALGQRGRSGGFRRRRQLLGRLGVAQHLVGGVDGMLRLGLVALVLRLELIERALGIGALPLRISAHTLLFGDQRRTIAGLGGGQCRQRGLGLT